MSRTNQLRSEQGSISILMAVSMVFLMITMYLGSSSYINYRAKLSRRVTESYRLIGVFEEVGRIIRSARDTGAGPTGMNWPAPNPACALTCQTNTGVMPQICVPHPTNPTEPYCFSGPDINVKDARNMEFRLNNLPQELEPPAWSDRMFAQVEMGLGVSRLPAAVAEQFELLPKAYALPALDVIATRADLPGAAPNGCLPDVPPAIGCITCGGPDPTGGPGPVTCVTVSACPTSYPGCIGGTSGTIRQTFFLLPGGYIR